MLLDENVDWRLKRSFGEGFEVMSVDERGRKGKDNGELLAAAHEEFDALVTMDRSIPYQQNLAGVTLVILLLEAPSNRLVDLAPLAAEAKEALGGAQPGDVLRVPAR